MLPYSRRLRWYVRMALAGLAAVGVAALTICAIRAVNMILDWWR